MLIKHTNVEDVDAADRVIAESVVARNLVLVDELGEPAIKLDGPKRLIEMAGPDRRCLVSVSIDDGVVTLYMDTGDDDHVSLTVGGGFRGPAVAIGSLGIYFEAMAQADACYLTARTRDAESVWRIAPGEEPVLLTTAVEGGD